LNSEIQSGDSDIKNDIFTNDESLIDNNNFEDQLHTDKLNKF